jgi:nickel-dependent lactate racemase
MRVTINYGRQAMELEVPQGRCLPAQPPPAPLPDPVEAVRSALEEPHDFPALRQALTPGDRVAVVVDEGLPGLADLLTPILEHILSAGVDADAITLLCPPGSTASWVEGLPEHLEEVRLETHDPRDRRRLSYLATTSHGRRLYLNRTLVDADQAVVLSGRRWDPLLGHGGAEGALYPEFADEETRRALAESCSLEVPTLDPWPARREAQEAAWLLGVPFFVQVIEAADDAVAHVVAGSAAACARGLELQEEAWRKTFPEPAELIVAGLSGDPARHTFADLAAALASAARVVRAGGQIVLLSEAAPTLRGEAEPFRAGEGEALLERLRRKPTREMVPVLRWARGVGQARVYLLSGLEDETVEDLSATALHRAEQVQKLIDAAGSVLFLADAHKMLTEIA